MAIILSEIVTRRAPYTIPDSPMDLTYVEVIQRVRYTELPPLRPIIGADDCPALITNVIQLCWSESPKDRLSVKDAQRLLKENGMAKGSVMDNIIR